LRLFFLHKFAGAETNLLAPVLRLPLTLAQFSAYIALFAMIQHTYCFEVGLPKKRPCQGDNILDSELSYRSHLHLALVVIVFPTALPSYPVRSIIKIYRILQHELYL
jgi:hypothetical protein